VGSMRAGDPKRPEPADVPASSWVGRLMYAARSGAPALRALVTANVELNVAFGSTKETARGATIVSEWLAGRLAVAQHLEIVTHQTRGSKITAQINFGGDPVFPVAWLLDAVVTDDGLATEISLRTQGSA
jgi:hypothetical protein